MPYNPGVHLRVSVRLAEPWDLLALAVEGAPLTEPLQALTAPYSVRVPSTLVSPNMAILCVMQSISGKMMTAELFAWSSVAVDDPDTEQDERWRRIAGPASSKGQIELSCIFRP